jgi:predicted dehydrogenase
MSTGSLKNVRLGIVGLGNMGVGHVEYLMAGRVPLATLTAVADNVPEKLERIRGLHGDKLAYYGSAEALMGSGKIDALIVATPHYDHPPICIAALKAGLHAMSEKPSGVYTKQVKELNAAAAKSDKVFGVMFNQRTIPAHQKVKELIASGELGEIRRVNYTITNWLRSQIYYDSGGWRGTWSGEGGGVLMNQCPHNLDLLTWWCGTPATVRAFCRFGQYHKIEVEDDVTAYLTFANGATGIFTTTTGEYPGISRLEIAADHGLLTLENDRVTFKRTRYPVQKFIDTTENSFPSIETWDCSIPAGGKADQHRTVTENFVSAIAKGTPLNAPGTDGLNGLSLANAMLLSTWQDKTVPIPFDDDLYWSELQKRIKGSTFKKNEVKAAAPVDISATYGGAR